MSKRLQLNPLAKTLLLKHRINVQKHEYNELGTAFITEQNRSKFIKFVSVSKSFLYLSQREDIYDFLIYCNEHNSDMFVLGFLKRWDYCHFELVFSRLQKMVQFLRPKTFYINMGGIDNFKNRQQIKQLLSMTNGNIKLGTSSNEKSSSASVVNILRQNHNRIHWVECEADILSEEDLIPRLKLDHCKLRKLDSYAQLNAALQNHDIKKLELAFNYKYEQRSFKLSDFGTFQIAPNVNSLKIHYKWDKDESLMKKMEKLISFLPNLKNFEIKVGQKRVYVDFDSAFVHNSIMDLYNISRQIKTLCDLNTKLKFQFSLDFILPNTESYSDDWIAQLKQNKGFANASTSVFETCPARNFFTFEHKVEDKNFEFNIEIDISHWFTGPPPIDAYDMFEQD